MFKCEVIETDIPYEYNNKNLSIKKLIKRYNQNVWTFKKLKEYGIKAIRSPRSITNKLSEALNKEE